MIFSVKMTKPEGSFEFGRIYWRNPQKNPRTTYVWLLFFTFTTNAFPFLYFAYVFVSV